MAITACEKTATGPRSIQPMEVQGLLNNDFAVLVDVREDTEIADGMAARAKWLPVSKIESDPAALDEFLKSVPKDKEIVFYCRSGSRAGSVAKQVAAKGYKVANMGGFHDWVAAGLPTEKPKK